MANSYPWTGGKVEAAIVPLESAYLCGNCNNVVNNARVCLACGDRTALVNLAGLLNRQPGYIIPTSPFVLIEG